MNKIQEIQKTINAMKTDGWKFGFEQTGKTIGPECDHCGKTGINLIMVYTFKEGQENEADPASDCVLIFGSGCIKHFNFN